jgi:hypothetical protein
MIRLLAIPVTLVALAVSAAPASAKMHLEDISLGTPTDKPFTPTAWWWPKSR